MAPSMANSFLATIQLVQRTMVQAWPSKENQLLPSFGPPNIEKLLAEGDAASLIRSLDYRRDPRVRRDAARALGQVDDAAAVEPLIAALMDDNWSVRQAAEWALGRMCEAGAPGPFIAALESTGDDVRKAAAQALGQIGD